jgi:dTDP-4-amino-4,6-dideoxygalactose transaminase
VFSFHPIKNLTTGEGGMLCTDSDDVAARARLWRFHGVDRDAWKRYGSGTPGGYDLLLPGFKYNLTDLQAALGIEQLRKLDGFIAERTRLAGLYQERLSGLDGLVLPAAAPPGARHAWHLYVVRVTRRGVSRDRFRERLAQRNIGTGLHFPAAHLLTWCRERLGTREGQFPAAEAAGASLVSLPLFPGMTDQDVDDVAAAVRSALDAG